MDLLSLLVFLIMDILLLELSKMLLQDTGLKTVVSLKDVLDGIVMVFL
jgi:hypothetical protein